MASLDEEREPATNRTLRLTDETWNELQAVAARLGRNGRAEAVRMLARAASRCPATVLAALMGGLVEADPPAPPAGRPAST
jgi:hypothetical protein